MSKPSKQLVLLGSNLRKLRQSKNLTQEELAALSDLDRSYVGQVERGERNVSILNLIALTNALCIPLSTAVVGL